MDIRLTKGTAAVNTVTAISSKSYVHRLLIASALCADPICVTSNIVSKDMEATVRALSSLGASITVKKSARDGLYGYFIDSPLSPVKEALINCGESGSTARFILPLAAYFAQRATLIGSGKLPERPMGPLCDVLKAAGVTTDGDHLPMTVSGKPSAGDYEIAGNVSSQYISGLLFLLPLLEGRSSLKITGRLESAAYVDMTEDVLKRFGIVFLHRDGVYHSEDQAYRCDLLPDDSGRIYIGAEGDWSNAAYIMAIAALGSGRVFDGLTIDGLDPESIQGDRAAADILKSFGVDVKIKRGSDPHSSSYTISGNPCTPVDIDCSQIPDLVPALASVAAYVDGDSVFRNIGRLRIKECDRVEAVTAMLGAVGVLVDIILDPETSSEDMIVHGKGLTRPVSGQIDTDSFNDHRIAMAASALAFAEDAPVIIHGAQAVDKSYPGFYEVIAKLGFLTNTLPVHK